MSKLLITWPRDSQILMTKFGLILGGLVALACMPAIAGGTSPSQDQVTGSTKFIIPEAHVRIEAHSDANGQNARGNFYLEQDPLSFGGAVTCLAVSGNLAAMVGRVDRSRSGAGFPAVGTFWLQFVEDNGSPGDMDRSHTLLSPTQPNCPTPTNGAFMAEQGNYVVHDAP